MNLAKMTPRRRRFALKVRRIQKRLLPRLLAARGRRLHQATVKAKRPGPPRWMQRQEKLIERERVRQLLVKPEFEG